VATLEALQGEPGPSYKQWRVEVIKPYGGFLKWWYPTTIGFPTKNDHFVVF